MSVRMDLGVIIMWITFEPGRWIANMMDGPHRLQLTHEGLPPFESMHSIQVNHPAHLPLISLLTTVGSCVVMVRGSITLMRPMNFLFASETSTEFPRMHVVAMTGSIVHMVTLMLWFDHLPKVTILLKTSGTSGV